jgi:integrase
MTIEKLPSGSYRIREMVNGKLYSLTVKKKPTDRVARQLLDEKIENSTIYGGNTFKTAADTYIEAKSNILSPSTIRGYKSMLRNIPEDFLRMDCGDIDTLTCQKLINEYTREHSAKSARNLNGFILSVLRLYNPDVNIRTTLPPIPRREPHIPTRDEISALLDASYNTEYYAALYLASLSCRLSEICALSIEDLDGDILTINKSLVRGEDGYILKDTPKTDASNRQIKIPDNLAEWIREHGYIYRMYPQNIDKYLRRTLPELGIEFFSVHKMRHFFASYAHDRGFSDAIVLSVGGWNTDYVMKKDYRHHLNKSEAMQTMKNDFTF